MAFAMQSLLKRGASFFTPSSPSSVCSEENTTTPGSTDNNSNNNSNNNSSTKKGPEIETEATTCPEFEYAPSYDRLFGKVDPTVDGEECIHDCSSCTIRYPSRFDVDMKDKLYGNIGGWSTHLLVATGKTDWVRDVADERGSVMEAIEKGGVVPSNGKLKLSASNMPVPEEYHYHEPGKQPTSVLLLPSFTVIDQVTPALTPDLINYFVNPAATTTTPLGGSSAAPRAESTSDASSDASEGAEQRRRQEHHQNHQHHHPQQDITPLTPLRSRPSPHSAVILLCSQRTRDVRCGQSAPLLRREFERHLRPLGLYRELDDERPGGVGIYFVSHVGGHKYAANVIVYRRRDFHNWHQRKPAAVVADEEDESDPEGQEGDDDDDDDDEGVDKKDEGASQGIWLARVRPEDCENIIRYTVLQGKVVKPGHQLRGGFDREKGLISW